jgi:hypothetical protein
MCTAIPACESEKVGASSKSPDINPMRKSIPGGQVAHPSI